MWGGQSPLNLKCSTYTGLKSLGDLENFRDNKKGWVFPFGLDLLKVTKVRGGRGGQPPLPLLKAARPATPLAPKHLRATEGGVLDPGGKSFD